jgi:hypothetical protein
MKHLRTLLAALAGYSIYELLVLTGGVAAALATPSGYFEYFGREHMNAALALWSLGSFAVPQFVLAGLLTYATMRILGTNFAFVAALIAGALLSWLSYMLFMPGPSGHLQVVSPSQFLQLAAAIYLQASWQLPASWSAVLGIAAGIALARAKANHHRPPAATEA